MRNITDKTLDSLLSGYYRAEPYYPSEYVIDPALFRAAADTTKRARVAAAAGFVLVGTASAALIFSLNQTKLPDNIYIAPATEAPFSRPTEANILPSANQAAEATAAEPSEAATEPGTQAQAETAPPKPDQTEVTPPTAGGNDAPSDIPPAAETISPSTPVPTQAATVSPTVQSIPTSVTGVDIDASQLCSDGKLYFAVASVMMNSISSPEAFTDEHLCDIKTTSGRVTLKSIPSAQHRLLDSYTETYGYDSQTSPASVTTFYYYYYNSDGTILCKGTM